MSLLFCELLFTHGQMYIIHRHRLDVEAPTNVYQSLRLSNVKASDKCIPIIVIIPM